MTTAAILPLGHAKGGNEIFDYDEVYHKIHVQPRYYLPERYDKIIEDKIIKRFISLEMRRYDKIMERLISSMRSNFLVRNNGELVDIKKSLQGKVVGLVFMSLPPPPEKKGLLRNCILDIASAYNELSKSNKGKFEIVLIAQGECESVFNYYLKMMPWLAVPFIESTTRNLLYSVLAKGIDAMHGCDITLFDCHGKLLTQAASNLFGIHGPGADGYPFTHTRLKEIRDEDDATRANMSLKNLLGNSTRDFVLENNGTEVPISRLEDMVVGIYFYDLFPGYLRTLVEVYAELKEKGERFEVVMVSSGGCRTEDYLEQVKKLPWLALPIDCNGRMLVRLFNSPFRSRYDLLGKKLVIIGPGASFVNASGSVILDVYGIDAYPFSRLSVAEMVKARLEEVSLRSLLTCGDQNDLISWSGEEVPISDILGKKTIVLYFSRDGWCSKAVFEQKLIKWYEDMKLTDAKFEVILVGEGYQDESSFNKDFCEMPWLALPYKDSRIDSLSSAMGGGVLPTLAVFARSGQLVSMQPKYCLHGNGVYGQNLLRDVYLVLADSHSWPPFDPCGEGEAELPPFGEGEGEAEFFFL